MIAREKEREKGRLRGWEQLLIINETDRQTDKRADRQTEQFNWLIIEQRVGMLTKDVNVSDPSI